MSKLREGRTCLRRVAFASLAACTLAGCADKAPSGPTPAAAPAPTQGDTVRQANDTELPALSRADRAVLSSAQPPLGTGKSVEVTDVNRIRRLIDALKPQAAPPSSGMETMTVRFYQGPTLLREVWVYPDGEWGFRRTGTSWATGRSGELVRLIHAELARVPGE